MPVDINGTTGIESPGYSQGGAPIVESGSNSDGEWTRWADGTQQCYKKFLDTFYNSSSDCRTDWSFPVGFIDTGASIFTSYLYMTDFSSSQRLDAIMVDVNNNSTTPIATTVRVFMQAGGFTAGNVIRVQTLAVGRWK